jgi:hypothetical protein
MDPNNKKKEELVKNESLIKDNENLKTNDKQTNDYSDLWDNFSGTHFI